jgi:hypothetical protein
MRLILIVGVTEDNDFVVAGRPEDVAVEVAEELPVRYQRKNPPRLKIRPDPQLGPSQKDRLARMEASRGGAMRSPVGTVLAEEIQSGTEVVLKPCWQKRTPRRRGNEDA